MSELDQEQLVCEVGALVEVLREIRDLLVCRFPASAGHMRERPGETGYISPLTT